MTTVDAADACCSSCAAPAETTALAIACTLTASDFRGRVASIRDLARRSLKRSERRPLSLALTYAQEALAEVTEVVAQEAECCSFLDFQLSHDEGDVHLTITAPPAAASAADELFAHFAPELAKVTA